MKSIILHENELSERGTSVAIYDYAYYLREYLNFAPIICYNKKNNTKQNCLEKFQKEFEVVGYEIFDEIQKLINKKNINYFYAIKYGVKDEIISQNCKNLIHSVFCTDVSQIHGDRYAVVSEWMSQKSDFQIPFVPHMINLPSHQEDYRAAFNIPNDAVVIGRYGGKETFNIDFVVEVIQKILKLRKDIWFLFLNTDFKISHERCLYFEPIVDLHYKVQFINTCDAFLHARDCGETFGLSVLEFASKNKQIISYDNKDLQNNHPLGGRNHFHYLKDNCFKYQNEKDLEDILLNINKNNPFDTDYLNQEFSPQSVIKKFEEVFIKENYWEDGQNNVEWGKPILQNKKLPISVGILSWKSDKTLRNTLNSYKKNGLFDIANDVTILFQEITNNDIEIANEYKIPCIGLHENIGIGNAFLKLAESSQTDNILLLEHDWELIEDQNTTYNRLKEGIELLNEGASVIKLRHRRTPGEPLYSRQAYEGRELDHFDKATELQSPHLFDCVHWLENPEIVFPDKIFKEKDYFFTTSRWAVFTNNPCLYKKNFYLNTVLPFKENKQKDEKYYELFKSNLNHYKGADAWKHSLEYDIGYWWSRQNFKVSCGEGLFMHNDIDKFENQYRPNEKKNSIAFIFAHRNTDKWSTPLSIINEFKRLGWKTEIYSLFNEKDEYVDDSVYKVLETRPDIIIHMDWGQHTSNILSKLKNTGAFCIMEAGDDPQRFDSNLLKAEWFDLILSPDTKSTEEYKKRGYNAEWWPHFADTNMYFPLDVNPGYVGVCSRGYNNGANIIDGLVNLCPGKIINKNGFHGEGHNTFLNTGEIILQQSRYGEITRRIFEGMACKKLIITDRLNKSTKIDELFTEKEDIVYYDNEADCLGKIMYYHNNPHEARKIAKNGYNKIIKHHTQKQRVEFIINKWKKVQKND